MACPSRPGWESPPSGAEGQRWHGRPGLRLCPHGPPSVRSRGPRAVWGAGCRGLSPPFPPGVPAAARAPRQVALRVGAAQSPSLPVCLGLGVAAAWFLRTRWGARPPPAPRRARAPGDPSPPPRVRFSVEAELGPAAPGVPGPAAALPRQGRPAGRPGRRPRGGAREGVHLRVSARPRPRPRPRAALVPRPPPSQRPGPGGPRGQRPGPGAWGSPRSAAWAWGLGERPPPTPAPGRGAQGTAAGVYGYELLFINFFNLCLHISFEGVILREILRDL